MIASCVVCGKKFHKRTVSNACGEACRQERKKALAAQWRKANLDKACSYVKKSIAANPERAREYDREYYQRKKKRKASKGSNGTIGA